MKKTTTVMKVKISKYNKHNKLSMLLVKSLVLFFSSLYHIVQKLFPYILCSSFVKYLNKYFQDIN